MSPAAAVLLVLAPLVAAQDDELRQQFRLKRDLCLVGCARRHYDLAKWCWNVELLPQSTAEVLYALELSDDRHKPSKTALAKMQALDGEFWQKERKPPRAAHVNTYNKKAKSARKADLREHLELAKWAHGKDLVEEAQSVYERILKWNGDPIELDKKGRIKLEKGTVPEDLAELILADAVTINGRLYIRDEFLANLPSFDAIYEATSDELRVRSPLGEELVNDLHALGEALLPILEKDLAGSPVERMELFVFPDRGTFEEYLRGAGLGVLLGADGVADRQTYVAVVCAAGKSDDDLRGLVLHELTHLFHYGVTRAVLPDWYAEGLAETYGGQGSFEWNGKKLKPGGFLAPHRMDSLRNTEALIPLREMLTAEAAPLFAAADKSGAWRFYAQSWAFVRFLRYEAGEETAERFRRWETMATGAALGAEKNNLRSTNAAPAHELFLSLFEKDLTLLADDFEFWLSTL